MSMLRRLGRRLWFGLLAIILICSPVLVGAIAYWATRGFGHDTAILWAEIAAGIVVLLGPMYLIGQALEYSYKPPVKTSLAFPIPSENSELKPEEEGAPKSETGLDSPCTAASTSKDQSEIIGIWKVCVDVQKHFNDIELRIREFAVTLLVAVLGASAFAFKEHYQLRILGQNILLAEPILLAGIIGLLAFYFMDRLWYHQLLLGSVFHTAKIEKSQSSSFPELGLTKAIGDRSPIRKWRFDIHSTEKIDLFYGAGLVFLLLLVLLVHMTAMTKSGSDTKPNSSSQQVMSSAGIADPASTKTANAGGEFKPNLEASRTLANTVQPNLDLNVSSNLSVKCETKPKQDKPRRVSGRTCVQWEEKK